MSSCYTLVCQCYSEVCVLKVGNVQLVFLGWSHKEVGCENFPNTLLQKSHATTAFLRAFFLGGASSSVSPKSLARSGRSNDDALNSFFTDVDELAISCEYGRSPRPAYGAVVKASSSARLLGKNIGRCTGTNCEGRE